MLMRFGLRLSALTLLGIWIFYALDFLLSGDRDHDLGWYLAYGVAVYVPTLALIWLGMFLASVVRKGSRLARTR